MSNYVWGNDETKFFYQLSPTTILRAVESIGLKTSGRCLPLNSMENRVYEVELDHDPSELYHRPASDFSRIVKFYRPGRWSKDQILEEHKFMYQLEQAEIPVITPIKHNEKSLFKLEDIDIWFAIFPKTGGRAPDEMNNDQLEFLGRLLARLHTVGEGSAFEHRIKLTPDSYGLQNIAFLKNNNFIPPHIEPQYLDLANKICDLSIPLFENIKNHRVHGDCHLGNILWGSYGPFLFDFDDSVMGPAVQDIWLIIPGRDQESIRKRQVLLYGYESFKNFDHSTLKLIEPLRALRMIHFSAWIAKRWQDPAFQQSFPLFGTDQYWYDEIRCLQEQVRLIENSTQQYEVYY